MWDILLPLAKTPDRRDRHMLVSPLADTDKVGKWNCQSANDRKSLSSIVCFVVVVEIFDLQHNIS